MEPVADPGSEPAEEAQAPEPEPAAITAPDPPRRRRSWLVLPAVLAVVAAVLLLLPTTTIARPALIAP